MSRSRKLSAYWSAIALATSLSGLLSGCGGAAGQGGSDHPRADASGTVTFDGNPIPAGSVVFTHAETGTYSTCPIEDGEYENESGDGPILGANTVSVVGLDGAGGKALWSGVWSQNVTVEGDSFSQNFEVKSAEVQPPKDIGMDEESPLYE